MSVLKSRIRKPRNSKCTNVLDLGTIPFMLFPCNNVKDSNKANKDIEIRIYCFAFRDVSVISLFILY